MFSEETCSNRSWPLRWVECSAMRGKCHGHDGKRTMACHNNITLTQKSNIKITNCIILWALHMIITPVLRFRNKLVGSLREKSTIRITSNQIFTMTRILLDMASILSSEYDDCWYLLLHLSFEKGHRTCDRLALSNWWMNSSQSCDVVKLDTVFFFCSTSNNL